MDFLADQAKKLSDNKPEDLNHKPTKPEDPTGHKPTSSADLMSSAKLVSEAAQAAARKDTAHIDKAKVAEAAADLLGAAGDYGKLDDKSGVGQYLDKAEKYLHDYGTNHHSSTTTTAAPAAGGAAPANAPTGEAAGKKDDGDSGSGLGGYMKMAQGFMK